MQAARPRLIMEIKMKRVLDKCGVRLLQFLKYFEATAAKYFLASLFGALTDGELWFLCRFTRSLDGGKHQLQVERVSD